MKSNALKNIRVAIVTDAIYPYNKGGKETRVYELSTRLARDGYDVHIYTMKWWDGPSDHRTENGVRLHAISKLIPLYSGERRSIRQGIVFGVSCLRLLGARFDVVDVDHMPYFPLFFMKLVCLIKRKPMIATWHEVWGREYWREYLGRPGFLAYAVERMSMVLPTKIIAVSDLTAHRLKHDMNVSKELSIVPNGIDLAAAKQVRTGRLKSDIIYAGRLLEHKNVDLLLRAVVLIKKRRPDVVCFIVGDGPERGRLEQLSRKLGLDENVRFFGFLPEHSQVYAYMKASKVFVTPSTREGFGITVLEANVCGLPVVTVNHTNNAAKDLVTPVNGRVAKVSASDIARQTEELLDAPLNRRAIVALVDDYDWQHSAQSLREVYAS